MDRRHLVTDLTEAEVQALQAEMRNPANVDRRHKEFPEEPHLGPRDPERYEKAKAGQPELGERPMPVTDLLGTILRMEDGRMVLRVKSLDGYTYRDLTNEAPER